MWSFPLDGAAPEPAGLEMSELGAASVHPDGRRLAFVGRQKQRELWVIRNLLTQPKAAR
jgi:hypothetical protein